MGLHINGDGTVWWWNPYEKSKIPWCLKFCIIRNNLWHFFSCDIWFVITVLFTKSISIENVIGHYITINWLILATSFDWHMVSDDIKLRPGARQRKYQIFFLLVFSSCSFHQIQPKSNVTYYRSRWAYEYATNVRSAQWKLSDHIVKDSNFFVI